MAVKDWYIGTIQVDLENGTPERAVVALNTNLDLGAGYLICEVNGLGVLPAAANAATGTVKGTLEGGVDTTGLAAGSVQMGVRGGTRDFKNSVANPCSAATVGKRVYAADYRTVSANSADGPPLGKLMEFNPANQSPGCPCRVKIETNSRP